MAGLAFAWKGGAAGGPQSRLSSLALAIQTQTQAGSSLAMAVQAQTATSASVAATVSTNPTATTSLAASIQAPVSAVTSLAAAIQHAASAASSVAAAVSEQNAVASAVSLVVQVASGSPATATLLPIQSAIPGLDPYVTAPYTVSVGQRLLAVFQAYTNGAGGEIAGSDLTITDSQGLTWTPVLGTATTDSPAWTYATQVWISSPATATSIILTHDAGAFDVAWAVSRLYTLGNIDADPIGATAIGTNGGDDAASITLSAAPATTSVVIGVALSRLDSASGGMTEGAGWTEDSDISSGFTATSQSQQRTGSTSDQVSWADVQTGSTAFGGHAIAIEIKAAPGTGGGSQSASISAAIQESASRGASLDLAVSDVQTRAASLSAAVLAQASATASLAAAIQQSNNVSASLSAAVSTQAAVGAGVAASVLARQSLGAAVSAQIEAAGGLSTALSVSVLESRSASASLAAAVGLQPAQQASIQAAIQSAVSASASLATAIQAQAQASAAVSVNIGLLSGVAAGIDAAVRTSATASAGVSANIEAGGTLSASVSAMVLAASEASSQVSAAVQVAQAALSSVALAIAEARAEAASISAAVAVQRVVSAATDLAIQALYFNGAGLSLYIDDGSVIEETPPAGGIADWVAAELRRRAVQAAIQRKTKKATIEDQAQELAQDAKDFEKQAKVEASRRAKAEQESLDRSQYERLLANAIRAQMLKTRLDAEKQVMADIEQKHLQALYAEFVEQTELAAVQIIAKAQRSAWLIALSE